MAAPAHLWALTGSAGNFLSLSPASKPRCAGRREGVSISSPLGNLPPLGCERFLEDWACEDFQGRRGPGRGWLALGLLWSWLAVRQALCLSVHLNLVYLVLQGLWERAAWSGREGCSGPFPTPVHAWGGGCLCMCVWLYVVCKGYVVYVYVGKVCMCVVPVVCVW